MDINCSAYKVAGLLAVALLAQPTFAAESELFGKLRTAGFGSWAVGNSDEYPYLTGTGEGESEFTNYDFALAPSAQVSDRLTIYTQLHFSSGEHAADLDYAVAEWDLTSSPRLRLGRSSFPIGLYSDISHVGTLRPIFSLPQSIYGHTGFLAEAYNGIGISGNSNFQDGWRIGWDVYFGGADVETANHIHAEEVVDPLDPMVEEEHEESLETDIHELLGGRLRIDTPLDGLSFGLSAYAGEPVDHDAPEADWGDVSTVLLHMAFERGKFGVRGEIGRHEQPGFETDAFYVEADYYLDDHWQLAFRFEDIDLELDEGAAAADSLLEHQELVFGINYWFSDALVIKFSYHDIDGNMFALPEHHDDFLDAGGVLEESNRLINLGVNFSF